MQRNRRESPKPREVAEAVIKSEDSDAEMEWRTWEDPSFEEEEGYEPTVKVEDADDGGPHTCPICRSNFKTAKTRSAHVRWAHTVSEQGFECSQVWSLSSLKVGSCLGCSK